MYMSCGVLWRWTHLFWYGTHPIVWCAFILPLHALGILDIDECVGGTAGCPSQSTCMNTIGSFTCNCNSGYRKVADICEGNYI